MREVLRRQLKVLCFCLCAVMSSGEGERHVGAQVQGDPIIRAADARPLADSCVRAREAARLGGDVRGSAVESSERDG
jgi:hypothetical protein